MGISIKKSSLYRFAEDEIKEEKWLVTVFIKKR
jgi:hypothetical protein